MPQLVAGGGIEGIEASRQIAGEDQAARRDQRAALAGERQGLRQRHRAVIHVNGRKPAGAVAALGQRTPL